jgi:hypothetical protein
VLDVEVVMQSFDDVGSENVSVFAVDELDVKI